MGNQHNNIRKETLLTAIKRMSERELRKFITDILNDTRAPQLIIDAFERNLSNVRTATYYLDLVQDAYIDATNEHDYIYHSDQLKISIAVDEALEAATAFCNKGDVESAFTICFSLLNLYYEYKDCADDSFGTMHGIVCSTMTTLCALVDHVKDCHDDAIREEFMDNCWDCIDDEIFDDSDHHAMMYNFLCLLANCDEEYQAILDGLEEDDVFNTCETNYQHRLRIKQTLLTQWHGEEAGVHFMERHIDFPDFRDLIIQRAMGVGDYQRVYQLCHEGLAKIKG